MLWIAAAAIAASTPQSAPRLTNGPVVQALATVRIISGVRIRLDGRPNGEAPAARASIVHTDGSPQPATLIEFQ